MKRNGAIGVRNIMRIGWLFVMLLAACTKQGDADANEEKRDTPAATMDVHQNMQMQPKEEEEDAIRLSQDIETLVKEQQIGLSIREQDGIWIPASPSFAERMMNFIQSHGDALVKAADVGLYDLTLKFDGYSPIHINLETNTFWFAGADAAYPFQQFFADQWERYIIRVIDGELRYDTFEKSIIHRLDFADRDGYKHTATLFFDGDIRLQVHHAETVIVSNAVFDFQTAYSMKPWGEQPLIAVLTEYSADHGANMKFDVFSYQNDSLHPVFSTSEMSFELEAIDYEQGEVTIRLPFADSAITYLLTEEERAHTDSRVAELKENGVPIDEEYIKSIQGALTFHTIAVDVIDTDHDGIEEVVLSTRIESTGARTPVWMKKNVDLIFEIEDQALLLK